MKQPEIARLESPGANPRLSTLKRVVAATGHSLKLDLDEDCAMKEAAGRPLDQADIAALETIKRLRGERR